MELTEKNPTISIPRGKTVYIKSIKIKINEPLWDCMLHVCYENNDGLYCTGRKFSEATFIKNESGYVTYDFEKHFYLEECLNPETFFVTVHKGEKVRPLNKGKFVLDYEFIDPPENGIGYEDEDDW